MLKNSNNNENNGAEGAATQPACAACKHQRKRCKRECILAPHFPADKTKEFQAVHKVFGVSNLGKLMSCVREVDRKKASESFIWEANCRLQDPALGPQGEYLKVCEELKKYKKLCEDLCRTVQLQRTTLPGSVIGWNGTNGLGNGIINSNNNAFSYNNDTGNNLMVDLSSYGFHSQYVQNPDKILKQQKDVVGPIVVPYQQQQQQQNSVSTGYHEQFYLPAGQYGSANAKTMNGVIWEDQS